jgi:hypothetical protein
MTFLTANTGIHPRQGFVSNCHTFASCAKNGWSSVASNTPVNVSFGESKLDGAKRTFLAHTGSVEGKPLSATFRIARQTAWKASRSAAVRNRTEQRSHGTNDCGCASVAVSK